VTRQADRPQRRTVYDDVITGPAGMRSGFVACDVEALASEPTPTRVKVPQPRVRRERGTLPRRGHIGGRTRPAAKSTTSSTSSSSARGDPDQGEPPGHRPSPSLEGRRR
jgi:hypothetical protein